MNWVITDEFNIVFMKGSAPDSLDEKAFDHMLSESSCLHLDISEGIEIGDKLLDGEVIRRPLQPSRYHLFDKGLFDWVPAPNIDEIIAAECRSKRDRLLAESDWTDTASAQSRLGVALFSAWATYRQALRDISLQPGFPLDVIWPDPPSS